MTDLEESWKEMDARVCICTICCVFEYTNAHTDLLSGINNKKTWRGMSYFRGQDNVTE